MQSDRTTLEGRLSLGVFHHGRIVHTQHFGKRDVDCPDPPDDDSVYWVASTLKNVTVSAIARPVTDGVLGWDVPVREYLRGLRQRDDELGLNATMRDLIANRSGLPMANSYWGQQNGEQLVPKSEFVSIVNQLKLAKPFRSTFIYSQWNFCLLQAIVESVTGKAFGDFVRECIFQPLDLRSATFDIPTGSNIMKPHANRDDGSTCKIKISAFDSASILASGGGGKSSLKDHLKIYIALLAAYDHQTTNDTDTSPGSPFTQLSTIFTPQIQLPGSTIEKQAYCLGLYRTRLPGNLSCASLNSVLPRKRLPIFSEACLGAPISHEEVYHHSCTTPGFVGAMFLIPRTQSGVVLMTNGTPRMDTADLSAQVLLCEQLNMKAPGNVLDASRAVVRIQLRCKTDTTPTHPLKSYTGIVVAVHGILLRVSIQGMPNTTYDLQPCDSDTFYWPASRENELVDRGMWVGPFLQFHLVKFACNVKGCEPRVAT
ncbi:beta-lactamase/transpeptidase-like protein [Lophiotrema nucula]|uniref:Beta-lactamase/transpeptidase-like protein n=1 Tax=Lophiotrema nucula TaxID=690887 RepID=A0A6A5ZT99_9PLEO|nr:beta-lactamase/transpeptidase-like protein [Lophiotrema nucula]